MNHSEAKRRYKTKFYKPSYVPEAQRANRRANLGDTSIHSIPRSFDFFETEDEKEARNQLHMDKPSTFDEYVASQSAIHREMQKIKAEREEKKRDQLLSGELPKPSVKPYKPYLIHEKEID